VTADRMIRQALVEQQLLDEYARCGTEDERRDLLIQHRINIAWPQFLALLGGPRDGLPPIRECLVVHARTGETMDARRWLKLARHEELAGLDDPPVTPLSASALATQYLTLALERIFGGKAGSGTTATEYPSRVDERQELAVFITQG